MASEPGELIGRGRAADIYALDADRVLRRILLRRFLAAVHDDHRPYLAPVAEIRLRDVNVRPSPPPLARRPAPARAQRPAPAPPLGPASARTHSPSPRRGRPRNSRSTVPRRVRPPS